MQVAVWAWAGAYELYYPALPRGAGKTCGRCWEVKRQKGTQRPVVSRPLLTSGPPGLREWGRDSQKPEELRETPVVPVPFLTPAGTGAVFSDPL